MSTGRRPDDRFSRWSGREATGHKEDKLEMNSNLRHSVAAALCVASCGLAAQAAESETSSPADSYRPHVFVTGLYALPDSGRDTQDYGLGAQIGYGHPLSDDGRWWLEGRFDYTSFETGSGRGTDFYQSTFGADLQYAFGNREQLTPFVLLGLGYVYNDIVPDSEDAGDLEGEAGVGLVTRIGNLRWLRARGDVRAVYDNFQSGQLDFRAHAGIEIALGSEKETIREVPVTVEKVVIREVFVAATDSDADGVPDQSDACPGTIKGAKVDGKGCVVENQTLVVLRDVSFDTESARLQLNGQRLLDDAASFLNSQSELKAEVVGYADNRGTEDYNLKLSERRAAAAMQYLLGRGIAADRLSSKGMGEAKPIASNDTDLGRETNRRIEFNLIVPTVAAAPAVAPESAPSPTPVP